LPQKARDVEAALKSKGFQDSKKKGRDHTYYFFHYNGKKTNIFTKISHGESEIHDKNCSSMAKQIKLDNTQFKNFVNCPLTEQDYLKILVDSKHLEKPSSS
jgi:predicted RNA binding protein YcfA (HicA-like mRNA interferase family)